MSNKLHYLLFIYLIVGTHTSFANESLNLHINTSEGGDVSTRKSQSLISYLTNNGCKIDSVSSKNSSLVPSKTGLVFMPLEQAAMEGYSKVADITIINDEKLSASILVRSSTGINNIKSLEDVHIALFSTESKIGYQLPQSLFDDVNITHSKEKITTVQTNLAAASLLLHKDVFTAVIATPLAKKWATSNNLTIVATSTAVGSGSLWVHKTVPHKAADACALAFSLLNKVNDKKLLMIFPAWLNGFHYINH